MTELNRDRVRKMLDRWGASDRFCAQKRRELDKYYSELNQIRELSGVPLETPKIKTISDPTYQRAAKVITVENAFGDYINDLAQQLHAELSYKSFMDKIINSLEPHKREVVSLYYKMPKGTRSWTCVAIQVGYDSDHCRLLERKCADEIIEKIIETEE